MLLKTLNGKSLVLVLVVTISISCLTQSSDAKVIPNAYIVQVADTADLHEVASKAARFTGGSIGHVYSNALRGFSIRVPPGITKAQILAQPGVILVEPDLEVKVCAQTLPTGVNRIDVDLNDTAKIDGIDERVDVDIAIIDTGIDIDHPDLNVVGGRRFYTTGVVSREDNKYDDDHGHGSHVAGIAAALDNSIGVVGVAPGARLWAVKVLDKNGDGYLSDVIKGVDWVTGKATQIEVVNMSLGVTGTSSAFRTAIQKSVAAGVIYVVAAGNDAKDVYGSDGAFSTNDDFIPAAYPEVATISAMADSDGRPGGAGSSTGYGSDDSFATFSNFSRTAVIGNPVTSPGAAIDLLMPGVSIYSTWKDGGYTTISGTSTASPHAAGLAALYVAVNGRATNAAGVYAIRQALIDSGAAQDSAKGLALLNDPDANRENIGWAGTEPPARTLTVTSTTGGTITQPGIGSFQYTNGSVVDLNAVPDVGHYFTNWTGDTNTIANVNAAVTKITMDANYAVQANFGINQYTVTASAGANGTVEPTSVVVDYGSNQDFNATANVGYEVDEWLLDGNGVQTGGDTYTLTDITADHVVYVTFKPLVFMISGYVVEIDGSTPVEGILIQADDNDINAVTDANGYYRLTVGYAWSGIVTPQKEGYFFEPNSDTYTNVTADYNDQNYMAELITFVISGYTFEQDLITPIIDVNICADNEGGPWTSRYGGGCDITDVNGFYEVIVDYNWSGNVVPTKYAYAFEPNSIQYNDVFEDLNDRNYVGWPLTFAISGYIKNECNNVPIQGVLVDANNGGSQDTTDTNGFYEVWVDYNWFGDVTAAKKYYTFEPNRIGYIDVLADRYDQNYVANNIYDLDCDGLIDLGDLFVIADNWLLPGPEGDFNTDEIVNFLDFAEFGIVWQDEKK